MSVIVFEGGAGTGKTTSLISTLKDELATGPLRDGQSVLALTYMHGSRKRLNDRLAACSDIRGRFHASTIDSFAWSLCHRWRSLLRTAGISLVGSGADYEATCSAAATLLENPQVVRWVARSFPALVVDEAQDLDGPRTAVLKALAGEIRVLAAADEYQDLFVKETNHAVEWLREVGDVRTLTTCHRTDSVGIIAAATALRNGEPLPESGENFWLQQSYTVNTAAMQLARAIAWYSRGGTVAVLSTAKPENSRFVAGTVARVSENRLAISKNQERGPFPIKWEQTDASEVDEVVAALPDVGEISARDVDLESCPLSASLSDWLHGQEKLKGRTAVPRSEVITVLGRLERQSKYSAGRSRHKLKAMTIHQAKNREFDVVVVLWPYEVANGEEAQRRLLYNAITRARRYVSVAVQDPRGVRISAPPFSIKT